MSIDTATRDKWDRASRSMDLMAGYGPERRWRPAKLELFEHMRRDADILFLALGTGLDIPAFPPGQTIHAIDISPEMIKHAQERIAAYDGTIEAQAMDVHEMEFEENSFDQVFTSCTFCSVPNPVAGLEALKRVLKPGGKALILEFSEPVKSLKPAYDLYSFKVLPFIGKVVADDEDSYQYLAESIRMHPDQETLLGMMKDAGFERSRYQNLAGGIVALHIGYRI